MLSTLSRCLRCCALAVAVALLAGCTRTILGTVQPIAPGAELAPIRVADLLIELGQFPARYPAVVLDATAVYRALQDVDGVATASAVNPPQCAPPPRTPQDAAAVQGIDSQDATSLIVTVTVVPAPPVDADDSYAVDQTVTYGASGSMRRTLTLAAQVGDVRVSATWLHEGTPEATPDVVPDTQALDALFTDAVLKVRRNGGP